MESQAPEDQASQASPATTPQRPFVIRIRGIRAKDAGEAKKTVVSAILSELKGTQKVPDEIDMVPSCYDDKFVALVDFDPFPQFLSPLKRDPPESVQLKYNGNYLEFDGEFLEFTQMYSPEEPPTVE